MPSRPSLPPHAITISTATILKVAGIVAAIYFIFLLKNVLAVLFTAVLLAALIDPFADHLHRRGVPRTAAVILIYLVLILVAALAMILIIPPLITQLKQIAGYLPSLYEELVRWFKQFQAVSTEYGFEQNFQESLTNLVEQAGDRAIAFFSSITGFFYGIAAVVLVFVLAFYMVVEEDAARRFFKYLAPEEYQPFLTTLFQKMQKRIGAWLHGQIVLGLVVGTATFIGLTIIQVPYALVLGIIAGLLEIIPYAGPLLAAIPTLIIAFSVSPITGILALILTLTIQQIENNFLVPKIMQKATGLNPVVSIVALMVGGTLFGVLGGVLAIPVATMVSVAAEELFAFTSAQKSD